MPPKKNWTGVLQTTVNVQGVRHVVTFKRAPQYLACLGSWRAPIPQIYDIYEGTGLSDMSHVTSMLLPCPQILTDILPHIIKNFDEHLSPVVKQIKAAELL